MPELVAEIERLRQVESNFATYRELRKDLPGAIEWEAFSRAYDETRAERDVLAAVLEAESTHKDGDACRVCDHMAALDVEKVHDENDALAQQVEKVRALHQPWDDGPQPYCTHDREPWPCPTEQALGAR